MEELIFTNENEIIDSQARVVKTFTDEEMGEVNSRIHEAMKEAKAEFINKQAQSMEAVSKIILV